MKISFNPSNSNKNILDLIKNNKDIIFDLKGHSIFARGVEFKGTDTNTWRPVVDNLTSDSTTSSLSAKQGKVLKALIDGKSNSDHNHDGRYVRAFGTSNDNIDSDWGQSFKTFDSIPLGTPPEKNPNISLLSIGENFNRRKQLAFIWDNDNIYYRRHIDRGFTNWRRLAFANEIPTSLKNPYALTISLNGTSQGPYDGSAAKNINITPGSIGAAVSNHSHDYLVVNSADDKSFNSAYHNFQVLYAGGGNGITGKPANVDAFGLFKFRAASGWSGQMLLANGGSLYIRSSEDAKMTNTLAWKTILDSSNYSGILDSRYYTESEVNSLLDAKLNRQNLSYGNWNPRGYHLAADYHYNGGDLSISENNGKMYISVNGCFWQNEGQYRVLDTSDIGDIRNRVTLHQYLSATDVAWYPLVWGGNTHHNTSDSTGAVYKSYDKLSWQTSSQTLYATNIQTNNIKNLSIGGGIYWNPYVESASDNTNAASITLVRSGVAGGITLVLSQMNDTNDTIQFKTNTAARLYHNNYPILTTQNTYVSNKEGYINGTKITQVNNSDTVDGWQKDEINRTLYITSSTPGLSSYWAKLWEINLHNQYNDVTITFLAAASFYPSYFSIFSVYLRQNGSGTSKNIDARLVELIGNIDVGDTELRLYVNNTTGNCQLWGNVRTQYGTMNLSVLKKAWRTATDSSNIGTFFSTVFNSVQSLPGDGWYKVGVTQQGVVGAFKPAAHTHTVFKNNLMIKGTNGISDGASIHLGIGDSDTGFKWISDGVCQIYANNSAIGQWTSGGMNWFKNPTVNGNKVWNAGNDGSGSGLDADTLDGYHANGSNDRPYGHIPTIESNGVMEVGRYIDFHNDNNGKHDFSTRLQSTGNYGNDVNLPSASGTLALITDVDSYYWANVKISTSSSTTTSPTVHTLTATRVCAGHNPEIDNSISCSNWFRSSGNTGWYNTTYHGGWYMSDTSWIRAHNGVGIYTSGQIFSPSSIRMSNILLEHNEEINNSANGKIYLNYRNSGDVILCRGGGNVGIGTTVPTYKLDVYGQMRAKEFHLAYRDSNNYMLLAGGGYKSLGGTRSDPRFLGYLNLSRGNDGTINSSFFCLGEVVPFTYTIGGNYCKIVISNTARRLIYIDAAIASVNYSGGGMDTRTGYHRGSGAWQLHCYAVGGTEIRVKGFCQANKNNDSWWGGNPLWNNEYGANKITVCIFGHVDFKD